MRAFEKHGQIVNLTLLHSQIINNFQFYPLFDHCLSDEEMKFVCLIYFLWTLLQILKPNL